MARHEENFEREICVALLWERPHNKFQRLFQGNRSVDEYYKEIKISLIRDQIEKSQEATMSRFLHGLNREIQDIVESHQYASLEDLIHQAIKVEQQVKRKQTYKKDRVSSLKFHEKVLPLVKIILTLLPLLQK